MDGPELFHLLVHRASCLDCRIEVLKAGGPSPLDSSHCHPLTNSSPRVNGCPQYTAAESWRALELPPQSTALCSVPAVFASSHAAVSRVLTEDQPASPASLADGLNGKCRRLTVPSSRLPHRHESRVPNFQPRRPATNRPPWRRDVIAMDAAPLSGGTSIHLDSLVTLFCSGPPIRC